MKPFFLIVFLLFPLAYTLGQTDTLSECEKRYRKITAAVSPDWIDDGPQPTAIKNDPPAYPDSAKLLGKEGTVWIMCIVDTASLPQCIRVIEKAGWGFDEASVAAVKKWRFIPARNVKGKYEESIKIPFKFKLDMQKGKREN